MIIALNDEQDIVRQVFACDIPGGFVVRSEAANAQALTLTNGVVHQTAMLSNTVSVQSFDNAWLRGQVALQKSL